MGSSAWRYENAKKKIDLDGTEVIVKSGEYQYFILARREFSFNLKLFLRQRYE